MIKIFKSIVLIGIFVSTIGFCWGGKTQRPYRAAGVLPYAYGSDGKMKFLLGLSAVHGDKASDFGGLCDDEDNNNPRCTAAREGCEELMFIFDNNASFERILAIRNKYGKNFDCCKSGSMSYHTLLKAMDECYFTVSNNYIMHFVHIPYQEDLIELFKQRKNAYAKLVPHSWNETVRLVWVDVAELFDAIDKRGFFGSVKLHDFTLYEPFVQSLMVARSHGIIANIAVT